MRLERYIAKGQVFVRATGCGGGSNRPPPRIPYPERLCFDGQSAIMRGIESNWLRRFVLVVIPARTAIRRRLLEKI